MRHIEFAKHMLIFVGLVMCSLSFVMAVPGIGEATTALDFDGVDAYVTFGSTSNLGLAEFSIECWFKREGTGSSANTGTGGFLGIPLVTKGVGEADGSNVDMNYFLGIRSSDNVLAADFEEAPGGPGPAGQNHPVFGTTPIPVDPSTWYHAAATYDGTTWRLYLDGNLEAELTLAAGVTPRSDSIQHAGLAAALNSNGARSGLFDGVIDEVRIWDHARTLLDIQSSINSEITGPASGLVARWGLNEGIGTAVNDSAGNSVTGTIMNSGWSWVVGAPFDIVINNSPDQPELNSPFDLAADVSTSPTLDVTVSDPESEDMTVTFYGRDATNETCENFTIVALPDTQFYSASMNGGSPAIFNAQTQWIVDNQEIMNVAFVTQLGDCVQNGDNNNNSVEWEAADFAMSLLEDPTDTMLPEGIPYGIAVGNHDQSPFGDADGTTTFFNQFFGEDRFTGGTNPLMTQLFPGTNRSYYGGHFGSNNDNHFELFSAGKMDFIIIHLEYDLSPDTAVLDWADARLKQFSTCRGIVVSHYILGTGNPGSFGSQGQAIYDALKDNPNLFLMLSGHMPEEGRREDIFNGNTVFTLLSDYQNRSNGGDGWLRTLEFSPSTDEILVQTYSPTLDLYETDDNSQFTLSYDMQACGFEQIGINTGVSSGFSTTIDWPDLRPLTDYEWYVVVDDGNKVTTGPIWSFTTLGIPGDFDGDCDVDDSDLAVFAADFGRTDCATGPLCEGDLEPDGNVDGSDLAIFTVDFGRTDCP